MLRRLAAYCYEHRWRVLILWIVLLVGVNVLAQTVGGDLLKTFDVPGSESGRAFSVLGRDFARKGDTGDLVFKVNGAGNVRSPKVMAAIQPVMAELVQQPQCHLLSSRVSNQRIPHGEGVEAQSRPTDWVLRPPAPHPSHESTLEVVSPDRPS